MTPSDRAREAAKTMLDGIVRYMPSDLDRATQALLTFAASEVEREREEIAKMADESQRKWLAVAGTGGGESADKARSTAWLWGSIASAIREAGKKGGDKNG